MSASIGRGQKEQRGGGVTSATFICIMYMPDTHQWCAHLNDENVGLTNAMVNISFSGKFCSVVFLGKSCEFFLVWEWLLRQTLSLIRIPAEQSKGLQTKTRTGLSSHSQNTFISTEGALRLPVPMTYDNHPIHPTQSQLIHPYIAVKTTSPSKI